MLVSRSSWLRPLLLSLLVVSSLASKLLHLYQHVSSISPLLLTVYFPTFFILEFLLYATAWFLLNRTHGLKSAVATTAVAFTSLITLVAASSQIGFFFVTGSEVRWNAAKSVGNDPEGRKLMLSGLRPVLCAAVFLLLLSFVLASGISLILGKWLSSVFTALSPEDTQQLPGATSKGGLRKRGRQWTLFVCAGVFVLWLVRPSEPYNHISSAIPFALFTALLPDSGAHAQTGAHSFPFPDLLQPHFWESPKPKAHYKGWAPKSGHFVETDDYLERIPEWASSDLPTGFERWMAAVEEMGWSNGDAEVVEAEDGEAVVVEEEDVNYYDPVTDPMRITNLDSGLLEPLERAVQEYDVPITHVALVIMESARKDIFPFKAGSFLHQKILDSYDNKQFSLDKLNAKLSRMTPVASMLTGESTGFGDPMNPPEDLWRDPSEEGMGGINVNGMMTGSTLSFKSALVNYCGVGPLPVDFMEEAESDIYQPCIMQIFRLFNQLKENDASLNGTKGEGNNRKWTSAFTQSITELYDKQNILNRHMGFDESVCREQISNSRAKYHHSGMREINYFGYPEAEVYPYMKDMIEDAVKKDKRLFLSHFTSTTHHPWNTPGDFENEHYFEESLLGTHDDMDKYLNTVRYVDSWLGKFMGLLEETGISNETLVVFVGDQ